MLLCGTSSHAGLPQLLQQPPLELAVAVGKALRFEHIGARDAGVKGVDLLNLVGVGRQAHDLEATPDRGKPSLDVLPQALAEGPVRLASKFRRREYAGCRDAWLAAAAVQRSSNLPRAGGKGGGFLRHLAYVA